MNDEINFDARNMLTEYSLNYRYINSPLWYCYIGLGGKLSQLANYLFCKILDSRLYGEKAKTKSNEDKRIYTDVQMTMERILRDINPNKNYEEKNLASDKGNLMRRVKELEDLNIFYYWKHGDFFIFVMERDIGCWRFYNSKGRVVPKTLRKIVVLAGDMVKYMIDIHKKNNIHVSEEEIRLSYGKFLRKMIGKLNPLVAHSLPIWGDNSLGDYLKKLKESLDGMHEYSGLTQADDFVKKIPPTVARKLEKYIDEAIRRHSKSTEGVMIKQIEKHEVKSLELELVPKDQNIVKKRRERKLKTNIKMPEHLSEPSEPKLYRYDGEVNPFKDAKEFMRYYRAFLTMKFFKSVNFDGYQNDAIYAAQILDILIANKRNDKVFLNGWLSHFCDQKLKGTKAYKTKYTSMKALKETFVEFNPLFPYVDA